MPSSFKHVFEPGDNAGAPPLLLLHGTGGNEQDLLPLGRTLSPGSALIAPLGNVNERGAPRFFARLAEGLFDPAEVTQRTHELADFIAAAAAQYQFDPARLVAVGFSNGANIAGTLLLLRPVVLGAAVLFRPMVVLDLPAAAASLVRHAVFIASGGQDPIVPGDHPLRLAAHLRAGGAAVSLHTHPAGHTLTASDLSAARGWFARNVFPAPAS